MKALSLTQPWATLVASGAKRVETRSWNTKHRGTLAIHAAKGFPGWAKDLCVSRDFLRALYKTPGFYEQYCAGKAWKALPLGGVIALTELSGVFPTERVVFDPKMVGPTFYLATGLLHLPPSEEAFGDYSPGRFAWVLGKTTAYRTPYAAKGALGLWEWTGP